MLDISVIILTYNEEIHIRRCIQKVKPFVKDIYIVDCYSTDQTVSIAESLGVKVLQHQWPGNQAVQFNWALENIQINTEWILRLDADEYLTDELVQELQTKLSKTPKEIAAYSIPLGRAFLGRKLNHGIVNGIKIVRLFRTGKAYYEQRLMDERLVVDGEVSELEHQFVDDSRLSIKAFVDKHNGYSSREAALLLDAEYGLYSSSDDEQKLGENAASKRAQKAKYARMPLFWRSLGYFIYRYVIKFGFLDGKEGFLWDFFQGFWYRMLVDAKVFEIKKACGNDKEKIRKYLKEVYHIAM